MNPSKNLKLPKVIFGTSNLGNLYQSIPFTQKKAIVSECLNLSAGKVFFDSAGKYGAGLALEDLGQCLKELNADPERILISNKLGWMRTELKTKEPTFEPGVWHGLKHDAYQNISYEGIIECYEQGNELLGDYKPRFLSVHDPDEYLASANSDAEYEEKYNGILEAYKALQFLKQQKKIKAIGIGAKDWKIIQKISADVELDWVMFANSLTLYSHSPELLDFISSLHKRGVTIINSAVFNGGFLVGSDYFNYRLVRRDNEKDKVLFEWRDRFNATCKEFNISPAQACVSFAFSVPEVQSVALNSSSPDRVSVNLRLSAASVPPSFWEAMKARGLLNKEYPYV